jgi:hypothetical protein
MSGCTEALAIYCIELEDWQHLKDTMLQLWMTDGLVKAVLCWVYDQLPFAANSAGVCSALLS